MLGNVDDTQPDVNCYDLNFTEEVVKFKVFSDHNDMEGFEFTGYFGGLFYANANGLTGLEKKLAGRIIGFAVRSGEW